MGPRFFKRGNFTYVNIDLKILGCFNGAALFQARKCFEVDQILKNLRGASMGPRFFKRGNKPLVPLVPYKTTLQWGRAFSSAEIAHAKLSPYLSCSFNGAALFQARKWAPQATVLFHSNSFNGAALFQARKFQKLLQTHP